MPSTLDELAIEGSTYAIVVEFNERRQDGLLYPFTPNGGLKWTLTDKEGVPINGREDVLVDPPAQSIMIVLYGDDLKTLEGKSNRRLVTIEGTYNGVAGDNLPMIGEVSFKIINLVAVT